MKAAVISHVLPQTPQFFGSNVVFVQMGKRGALVQQICPVVQ
jgi:hypothetical protein